MHYWLICIIRIYSHICILLVLYLATGFFNLSLCGSGNLKSFYGYRNRELSLGQELRDTAEILGNKLRFLQGGNIDKHAVISGRKLFEFGFDRGKIKSHDFVARRFVRKTAKFRQALNKIAFGWANNVTGTGLLTLLSAAGSNSPLAAPAHALRALPLSYRFCKFV